MAGCGTCGNPLEVVGNQVGRRDCCPHCGSELRTCLNCRHRDESVAKACKEPFAEVPSDPTASNFCEYFQLGEGGTRERANQAALLAAAERLFRK